MAEVLLGFVILIIIVKVIVAATQEDERRKRFRRDFHKFMEGNWGNGVNDSATREILKNDYRKQSY